MNDSLLFLCTIILSLIVSLVVGFVLVKRIKNILISILISILTNLVIILFASYQWFFYIATDGVAQVLGLLFYGIAFVIISLVCTFSITFNNRRRN